MFFAVRFEKVEELELQNLLESRNWTKRVDFPGFHEILAIVINVNWF